MEVDMSEIYLNDLDDFRWAAAGHNTENLGKVSIAGEAFWIRDCYQDADGRWHGLVDNDLILTKIHGLKYNDTVCFDVTNLEDQVI